jgi:MoaA/NifB/PqqE/SkfB family radical SAM enzyme
MNKTVTISITLDEHDLEDIQNILDEGRSSGILEHIVEQAQYVQDMESTTDETRAYGPNAREMANTVFGFRGGVR